MRVAFAKAIDSGRLETTVNARSGLTVGVIAPHALMTVQVLHALEALVRNRRTAAETIDVRILLELAGARGALAPWDDPAALARIREALLDNAGGGDDDPCDADREALCVAAVRSFLGEPDALLRVRIAAGTRMIAVYAGAKASACPLLPARLGSDLAVLARDFYRDVHRPERHGALGPAARECVFLMCCRYVERNDRNAFNRPFQCAPAAGARITTDAYDWPHRAQFYRRLQRFERDVRARYAFRDEHETLTPTPDTVARHHHGDMLDFYLEWERDTAGYTTSPSDFGDGDGETLARRRIRRFLSWLVAYVCLADRARDHASHRVVAIERHAKRHCGADDDDD